MRITKVQDDHMPSKKRCNLKDVTFLLLIRIDTIERMENLLAVTEFLVSNFNTNIEVLEVAPYNNGILKKVLNKKVSYTFLEDDDPILYRTKYLNYMIRLTKTSFVAVWDVDVVAPVNQIIETVNILRRGKAEFVYPYTGKFLDTYFVLRRLYLKDRQIELLEKNTRKMKEMYPPDPVGGAFFCKLEAYIDIGLENEEFYGWGIEDGERFHRWNSSLKYSLKRVKGTLFHLSHPRGLNSTFHHNDQSFVKLRILDTAVRKDGLSKE